MATNADQRKWRQIHVSSASAATHFHDQLGANVLGRLLQMAVHVSVITKLEVIATTLSTQQQLMKATATTTTKAVVLEELSVETFFYPTGAFHKITILDKSPWDSLKIWHVFANRSVFDALEGRVCAKWRPPSPLVNVAPKKCTFNPLIQHWEGEGGGGNRRGAIFSEKVQVSQHFCPGL